MHAQLADIQGQVVAADVAGDADLEIIAVDVKGNLVCLNARGGEVWERRVVGGSVQGVTVGDVDGDGQLDVTVGTLGGLVYAVRGDTGEDLAGFPVRTGDKVRAAAR